MGLAAYLNSWLRDSNISKFDEQSADEEAEGKDENPFHRRAENVWPITLVFRSPMKNVITWKFQIFYRKPWQQIEAFRQCRCCLPTLRNNFIPLRAFPKAFYKSRTLYAKRGICVLNEFLTPPFFILHFFANRNAKALMHNFGLPLN